MENIDESVYEVEIIHADDPELNSRDMVLYRQTCSMFPKLAWLISTQDFKRVDWVIGLTRVIIKKL